MRIALITTDSREHYKDYANPMPYFGTAPQGLLDGFRQLPEAEIHVLSCLQQAPASSPRKLAENIWYHGLHVPKTGWLRTGYQGCVRAVRRKLKEIRPDIVHGQGTERDCSISAVLSGVENVLTIHGNMRLITAMFPPKFLSANWFTARLERLTIPLSGGVICISSYTQKAVAPLARKTWLLPNAVDWSFSGVSTGSTMPPRLLCVATVEPRKNQVFLIDALASLADRLPFQLRFFGVAHRHTDYGREFFDRVDRYPWCIYGGLIDRDQLRSEFAEAAMAILPTREDNCPMVVLESMAAGIPIAACNVGGVPDLITDRYNGLLMDPDSADSMSRAVEDILTKDDLRNQLVANGLATAKARFHPKVIAEAHLAIYREILEGGARTSR